jgi:sugar phosphate isomerase/epimerase
MIVSAKLKYRDLPAFKASASLYAPMAWVQLAFKSLDFNASEIYAALKENGLRVYHVHGPQIHNNNDLRSNVPALAELCATIGARWMLFHLPRTVNLRALQNLFSSELNEICHRANCSILWENDHGSNDVKRIVNLLDLVPEHAMCLDTNHAIRAGEDVSALINLNWRSIRVIHASNRAADDPRANGLPVFAPEGKINFPAVWTQLLALGWNGEFNLEYHRPYLENIGQLLSDKHRLITRTPEHLGEWPPD